MKITWSIPVRGHRTGAGRGELVRARGLIGALRGEGHEVVVVEAAARTRARVEAALYRTLAAPLLPRRISGALRGAAHAGYAQSHAERVAAAAREQGADLIIETQVHFCDSGARAAEELRIPFVLDDASPWTETRLLGAGLSRLARRTFRRQSDAANMVVVSSQRARTVLARDGIPAAQLRVVRNGVDPRAYGRGDPHALRERLGVSDRVVVGFVGSFKPWHRVDLLVEAVGRLAHGRPVHLFLIGNGPTRRRVRRFARRCGLRDRLTATGAVPAAEVPELLAACDIGVLPAMHDYGNPMALLEYAAAGLPVVAPDTPVIRRWVEPGATGVVFTPGNVGALTRAIGSLAGDKQLRTRLGAAAGTRITPAESWGQSARLLVYGIRHALPDRRPFRSAS